MAEFLRGMHEEEIFNKEVIRLDFPSRGVLDRGIVSHLVEKVRLIKLARLLNTEEPFKAVKRIGQEEYLILSRKPINNGFFSDVYRNLKKFFVHFMNDGDLHYFGGDKHSFYFSNEDNLNSFMQENYPHLSLVKLD